MTKEQQKATIGALLEERRGYELRKKVGQERAKSDDAVEAAAGEELVREMDGRLAAISSQLKALGHGAVKPPERASTRPSRKVAAKR